MKQPPLHRLLALSALGLAACAQQGATDDALSIEPVSPDSAELGSQSAALTANGAIPAGRAQAGEVMFDSALPHTNGRACGDCHVKEDARALSPQHVQQLLASNPSAPLFHPLDADDPNAANLTFNNLKHGLVRVTLRLPDNMDVIDFAGNVITNASRTIDVWRGVPTIENTIFSGQNEISQGVFTAGYQADGRLDTLEDQALGALRDHSQLSKDIPAVVLGLLSDFERTKLSSTRLQGAANAILNGTPVSQIPNPDSDPAFVASLTPAQARGKAVYDRACTGCHGGATDTVITNRAAHASLCFMPKHDGNLDLDFVDLNGNNYFDPNPEFFTLSAAAPADGCDEFLALGTSLGTMLGQMGVPQLNPAFNATANLPKYRFRFYTDGTRTQQVTDLPPLPVVNPDGTPQVDARGLPIFGPVGAPQLFTTDPGRAAISGRPQDFQAFDVPQLRGIAKTAPYFHDNLSPTLEDVVDVYSHTILPLIPAIGLLPQFPRPGSFFGAEVLSTQEKADLVEFLKVF